jgi:hypothetical protein
MPQRQLLRRSNSSHLKKLRPAAYHWPLPTITDHYRLLPAIVFDARHRLSDWYTDQADKAESFGYDPIKI